MYLHRNLLILVMLCIMVPFIAAPTVFAAEKTGTLSFEWTGSSSCYWDVAGGGLSYSTRSVRCDANETQTLTLKPGSYTAEPVVAFWRFGRFFTKISFTIKADEVTTIKPKVGQVAFYHGGKNPIWYVAMTDGTNETPVGTPGDHDLSSTDAVQTIDLPQGSFSVFYREPMDCYELPGTKKCGTRVINVRDGRLAEVRP